MTAWLRSILLLGSMACTAATFGGCDGGSSGTGITTAQGNVGSAVAALRHQPSSPLARLWHALAPTGVAHARGGLEDIRVRIENTRIEGRTDASGAFHVRGDFAGPIGMLFELPDSDVVLRLVITVPRGGTLTLSGIRLDGRSRRVTVDAQSVQFAGLVSAADCPRGTVSLVSRRSPHDGNVYAVDLAGASVQSTSGGALACASLTPGRAVDVEGDVGTDGRVEARSVEVDDDRGEPGDSRSGGSGSSGGTGGGSSAGEDGGSSGSSGGGSSGRDGSGQQDGGDGGSADGGDGHG